MPYLLVITAIALLALNIVISIRSLRDSLITNSQKVLQLVIIWLAPVLGALFIWYLRRSAYSTAIPPSTEWRNPPVGPDEDFPHT
jgi:hypothetical protein